MTNGGLAKEFHSTENLEAETKTACTPEAWRLVASFVVLAIVDVFEACKELKGVAVSQGDAVAGGDVGLTWTFETEGAATGGDEEWHEVAGGVEVVEGGVKVLCKEISGR